MDKTRTPTQVLDRLVAAVNAHDLDGLVGCFAETYALTDPVHPARSFTGAAQVRKNWNTVFNAVPDVRLDVEGKAVTDAGFWLEGTQVGTRWDGRRLETRMVFIAVIADGRISSAHMYAAPVEPGGPDIDAVFAAMAGHAPSVGNTVDETSTHRASQP
ncbi:hypothetical protein GCM10009721_05200 [Terrabacter tumescens]|uniref:SnoaL-like domain-containing protein n=1 Tax=Terrabacter tumescens TaxID=60443 RepID=A0ABQ2HKZ4_9MICO|nr:nuclear transport factor 2 family protein [Terrabacter tumescens]GGM83566.1 hypothetical protein GCM10009721_05200 [Terrabacter tumescens]